MDKRPVIALAAGVVVTAGLFMSFGASSTDATPSASVGRFQFGVTDHHAFVIDTATGQVWEKYLGDNGGENAPHFADRKLPDPAK